MANRSQTHTVIIPAGATGIREEQILLDQDFEQCKGVAVYENADGGIPNYKIGLKDSARTYQEQTHKNDWIISTEVAPKDRYKPMILPTNGTKLTIRTELPVAAVSDVSYDIVFLLEGKRQ
ncbi:hypothetical protein [Pontibacter pamirensis]|uniref:hypothetical protein n=1 Tax=Pontibacter pamirensis TaxID=2562824 RepID=UPI00138A46E1|nr:hypothetical protein [Pontibacter pamirensis]